jgi:hypothetical protein
MQISGQNSVVLPSEMVVLDEGRTSNLYPWILVIATGNANVISNPAEDFKISYSIFTR